jgi:hypothetical protein
VGIGEGERLRAKSFNTENTENTKKRGEKRGKARKR